MKGCCKIWACVSFLPLGPAIHLALDGPPSGSDVCGTNRLFESLGEAELASYLRLIVTRELSRAEIGNRFERNGFSHHGSPVHPFKAS